MSGANKELELVSVTKRYGETVAVDAINHKFQPGGYACLLGPSGCGPGMKSLQMGISY